jgi:hypothetical protein
VIADDASEELPLSEHQHHNFPRVAGCAHEFPVVSTCRSDFSSFASPRVRWEVSKCQIRSASGAVVLIEWFCAGTRPGLGIVTSWSSPPPNLGLEVHHSQQPA